VVRLFVAEAGFIGLSGGILGVGLGVLMGIVLTDTISGQATGWTFPFLFPYGMASQVLAAATVCSVLAGIYPARRAARLDVVEALAYE
jgi:putative ABC transport system permease protein